MNEEIEQLMAQKTKVLVIKKSQYNEYNIGDIGLVDGYVRGGDNLAYAVVIINNKFRMVDLRDIELFEKEYTSVRIESCDFLKEKILDIVDISNTRYAGFQVKTIDGNHKIGTEIPYETTMGGIRTYHESWDNKRKRAIKLWKEQPE